MSNPCEKGHIGSDGEEWISPRRNPECWELYDARGISCGYVCERCIDWKKSQYRDEIFRDSQYYCDEPIEDE
jgi:hypothetical protein